jgi:ABC-type transport system substrate-binding protein
MATTFFGDINSDSSVQPLFAIDPAYCCDAYFTHLDDKPLIALTWRAVDATSHAQAQQLYDQVQRQFAADASLVPLYEPDLTNLVSDKVTGFNVNDYGFYNWSAMGLRN